MSSAFPRTCRVLAVQWERSDWASGSIASTTSKNLSWVFFSGNDVYLILSKSYRRNKFRKCILVPRNLGLCNGRFFYGYTHFVRIGSALFKTPIMSQAIKLERLKYVFRICIDFNRS